MKIQLPKLQDNTKEVSLNRLSKGQKNIKNILYYKNLLCILKIIYLELISKYYDNLLVNHFEIKKIQMLIIRKYY